VLPLHWQKQSLAGQPSSSMLQTAIPTVESPETTMLRPERSSRSCPLISGSLNSIQRVIGEPSPNCTTRPARLGAWACPSIRPSQKSSTIASGTAARPSRNSLSLIFPSLAGFQARLAWNPNTSTAVQTPVANRLRSKRSSRLPGTRRAGASRPEWLPGWHTGERSSGSYRQPSAPPTGICTAW